MQQISTGNRIGGITFKQRNDRRIAVGIHKQGLKEILSLFHIKDETINEVLAEAAQEWANIHIIQRDKVHPAGYTHFAINSIKKHVAE